MSRMARKARSRNLLPLSPPTAMPATPIGPMNEPWQLTLDPDGSTDPSFLSQPAFKRSMVSPLSYFVAKKEMILPNAAEPSEPPVQTSKPSLHGTRAAS